MLRVTLEVSLRQLCRVLWIVLLLKGAGLILADRRSGQIAAPGFS
jgi:hypothetical protein